ncbi:MAG: hypothetical protein DRN78_02190 [Thermoproteota archaeon]|nr:MAG: hypothetical protein DRN78_02190 [Candidatus Korarchaeota archaeon]
MLQRSQILRCGICGKMIEVINPERRLLLCCVKPMAPLVEKVDGEFAEDNRPSTWRKDDSVVLEIGATPHEMTEQHHIIWLEVVTPKRIIRIFNPGDRPEVELELPRGEIYLRVLCNRHGLWKFRVKFSVENEDKYRIISKAVDSFNTFRAPEARARVLEVSDDTLKVEFTGNLCRTCGFYDYFEDFRLILKDEGLYSQLTEIRELEDSTIVKYKLKYGM